jgi:hypothetical protein
VKIFLPVKTVDHNVTPAVRPMGIYFETPGYRIYRIIDWTIIIVHVIALHHYITKSAINVVPLLRPSLPSDGRSPKGINFHLNLLNFSNSVSEIVDLLDASIVPRTSCFGSIYVL